jgi:hypothetical protein
MCPHCGVEGAGVITNVRSTRHCSNEDCPVRVFYEETSDRLLPAAVGATKLLSAEADELEARDDYEGDDHLQDVVAGLRNNEMTLRQQLEDLGYLGGEDGE